MSRAVYHSWKKSKVSCCRRCGAKRKMVRRAARLGAGKVVNIWAYAIFRSGKVDGWRETMPACEVSPGWK